MDSLQFLGKEFVKKYLSDKSIIKTTNYNQTQFESNKKSLRST